MLCGVVRDPVGSQSMLSATNRININPNQKLGTALTEQGSQPANDVGHPHLAARLTRCPTEYRWQMLRRGRRRRAESWRPTVRRPHPSPAWSHGTIGQNRAARHPTGSVRTVRSVGHSVRIESWPPRSPAAVESIGASSETGSPAPRLMKKTMVTTPKTTAIERSNRPAAAVPSSLRIAARFFGLPLRGRCHNVTEGGRRQRIT